MIVQPHLQYQYKNKKNIAAPTLKSTKLQFFKICFTVLPFVLLEMKNNHGLFT